MAPRKYKKPSKTKRIVKFLSVLEDKNLIAQVIRKAPDAVIKSICNAALNAANNPNLKLSPRDKLTFKRVPRVFWKRILNPKLSIASKRRQLQRGGALPLIPILISSVLSALGSGFLGGRD